MAVRKNRLVCFKDRTNQLQELGFNTDIKFDRNARQLLGDKIALGATALLQSCEAIIALRASIKSYNNTLNFSIAFSFSDVRYSIKSHFTTVSIFDFIITLFSFSIAEKSVFLKISLLNHPTRQ